MKKFKHSDFFHKKVSIVPWEGRPILNLVLATWGAYLQIHLLGIFWGSHYSTFNISIETKHKVTIPDPFEKWSTFEDYKLNV